MDSCDTGIQVTEKNRTHMPKISKVCQRREGFRGGSGFRVQEGQVSGRFRWFIEGSGDSGFREVQGGFRGDSWGVALATA